MTLSNEIRLLRYLVATGSLSKTGEDLYKGTPAYNQTKTKRYRLNATTTKDGSGEITAIDWDWQSQDTGLPPRRKDARQGAIHS